jgi:hypothetical protein
MKKLWVIFIAIFIGSFAILGWVGTEIFRQAPPIPREVVTSDGTVLLSGNDIQNGKTCGRRWAAWRWARSGAMVRTSRLTGRLSICTANPLHPGRLVAEGFCETL